MVFSSGVVLDQPAAVAADVADVAVGIRSPFFVPGDRSVLGLEVPVAGTAEEVQTYCSVRTMDALGAVAPVLACRDDLVKMGLEG
jgi:hypothetical protein